MLSIFNIKEEQEYINHKDKINLEEVNVHGNTALFCSSYQKCEWMLKHGANPNHENKKGRTPLFMANHKLSALLISYGASVQKIDNKGYSLLKTRDEAKLICIIENGFDFAMHNDLSYLNYAESRALLTAIDPINLNKIKINVHLLNKQGDSLLFGANKHSMHYLIKNGININHKNQEGRNALFSKVSYSVEEIEILVNANIEVGNIDIYGKTIFFYMSNTDNLERILECAKNQELNINALSYKGKRSALFRAFFPKAILLMKAGIDVNIVDEEGQNVLFGLDDIHYIKRLLKAGINIEQQNIKGETAIFTMKFAGMKKLIEAGANINHKNHAGESILNKVYYNIEQVQYLLDKGLDISYMINHPEHFENLWHVIKPMIKEKLINHEKDILENKITGNTKNIRSRI